MRTHIPQKQNRSSFPSQMPKAGSNPSGGRMRSDGDSELFKIAVRVLKYFSYLLFGFAIACVLASVLGAFHLALAMMGQFGPWLLRLAVVVGCMIAIAIVIESLRH